MPHSQAPDPLALAKHSLELTRRMLAAADEGQWDQVDAWEHDRAQELHVAFADTLEPRVAQRLVPLLQEMTELNGRLTALAEAERDTRGEQAHRLQQGRRAARAYGERDR